MKTPLPPRWMMKFFRWFCREELAEAIEGDLLVTYVDKRKTKSAWHANTWYLIQVLTFLQPFAVRNVLLSRYLPGTFMFINHLKVGVRVMRQHITYTMINVLGLAIGLSVVMLIAIYIDDELIYDRFHKNGDNIVRLTYKLETPNATRQGAKLPFPVKEELLAKYPEVLNVARFYHWDGDTPLLSYDNQKHIEKGIYFAENDVFKVFDFEFISGNPVAALSEPKSIVLTEKLATKYFGDTNPMGKVMQYKNEDLLVVTGVLKNIPEHSHIKFDVLLPIELQRQRWMGWGQYTYDLEKDWNWAAAWTYAQLNDNVNRISFGEKLQDIAEKHFNNGDQSGFSIEIQSLYDIHLKSDKSAEARANGSLVQLYGFGTIAVMILLVACINFVNLTSAQINDRLKEVGLRKIMGAGRMTLIGQFMTESLLLVSLSSILAISLIILIMPLFSEFMGKPLSIGIEEAPILAITYSAALAIALFSGIRPTLAVLGVNAIHRFDLIKSKQRFNRFMVIVQFIVCNLMFVSILVINDQLSFLQNKDLGFEKEKMLILKNARNLSKDQFAVLQHELDAIPAVVAIHQGYIAGTSAFTNTFKIVGNEDGDTYSLGIKWIGNGFANMFELEVIEGRDLNRSITSDVESGILINAAASKALGWTTSASVGKQLMFKPGGATEPQVFNVVGVLSDANFESLYDPIMPSVFRLPKSIVGGEMCIKLTSLENFNETISEIEAAWNLAIPEWPFEPEFLDHQIGAQYFKEERLYQAISFFTILAMVIAGSGLFGLASFAVQRRTKEIGIRKVLGASVRSIINLISKRFVWMMMSSFLLSTPAGYYLSDYWLQNFAYRIHITPEIFFIAGTASFAMVILAVGSRLIQAARSNPVNALRYE